MKDSATQALYDEAKEKGLWFYCGYQDLWFAPDELKRLQEVEGRFLWGVINWKLRNPQEKLDFLKKNVEEAQRYLDTFSELVKQGMKK